MIQGITLGANSGGTLESVTHDAITVTSQYEDYFRQETGWSGLLYKCANAKYAHRPCQTKSDRLQPASVWRDKTEFQVRIRP